MRETEILRSPPLVADLSDQRAWIDGRPVELGPKPFALLRALMEAPQRLVTKDELIDMVWGGRTVSDAVLTTAMRDLRRALGDDARKPRFIGTAHGRGYRFLQPVSRGDEATAQPLVEDAVAATVAAPPRTRPWRVLAIGVLLLLGALLAWRIIGTAPSRVTASSGAASIAVLPLEDLSAEGDQAYFSDGLAEEILNVLMGVEGLKVASRTSSFAFRDLDAVSTPEIARRLGVRHILEGSVRKAGAQVRVTVQLIDAETDAHLWSKTYDRALTVQNLLQIQDEIANAIVEELRPMLGGARVAADVGTRSAAAGTGNIEAYDLYLRSRELFLARSDMARSERFAKAAVEADPKFARGWEQLGAALFVSQGSGDRDDARRAIATALRLDPDLSLAHAIKGLLDNFEKPYDWARTIDQLERAIELDPKKTSALLWLGVEMHKLGYLDRSKTYLERCLAYDEAYDRCRLHLMWALHMHGETGRAIEEYRRLVRDGAAPDDTVLLFALMARRDEASVARMIRSVSDTQPMPASVEAAMRDPAADREAARTALRAWFETSRFNQRDVYSVVMKLGAYDLIRHEQGSFFGLWLPEFPEYRRSEAFKRFVRDMNIDDYWRSHGFPPQCRPIGETDFACT